MMMKRQISRCQCFLCFQCANNANHKCDLIPSKRCAVFEYRNESNSQAWQQKMKDVKLKPFNVHVTKQGPRMLEQHSGEELQQLLCLKSLHEDHVKILISPESHKKLASFEEFMKWLKSIFKRRNREHSHGPNQFPGGHPGLYQDYDPFRRNRYSSDRYWYERERENRHHEQKENETEQQSEPPAADNESNNEPPPSEGDGGGGAGGGNGGGDGFGGGSDGGGGGGDGGGQGKDI